MPRYPPDRWFDYSPFGVPLKGTRFLPLKLPIPLEKAFNIPPHLRFFDLVNEERKQSPDGIIAVHCTHGVNRTGYFICRYLIDYMKWDPKDALQEFEYARGHPVERENYIEDLMSSVDKSKSKVDVEEN
ncbi:unnamed protein product [Trichobilharzia szidati]|nr:unnamed protein product [Trichobilharzia szidati]